MCILVGAKGDWSMSGHERRGSVSPVLKTSRVDYTHKVTMTYASSLSLTNAAWNTKDFLGKCHGNAMISLEARLHMVREI